MKSVFLIPNLITAGAMVCGMMAIFSSIQGDYATATHLILVAAALDFLDGKVARMTRTTSSFGAQFDSLSDLVAFGVAPAVLLFQVFTLEFGLAEQVASGVCVSFTLCSALRLARFNVQSVSLKLDHFVGMPTPAGAACAISLYYLLAFFPEDSVLTRVAPVLLLALAYLMVSRVKYPSLKKAAVKRRSFDMLAAAALMVGLIVALRSHFRVVIVVITSSYAILGVAMALARFLHPHPADLEGPTLEIDSDLRG